jgi:hypothetical protein
MQYVDLGRYGEYLHFPLDEMFAVQRWEDTLLIWESLFCTQLTQQHHTELLNLRTLTPTFLTNLPCDVTTSAECSLIIVTCTRMSEGVNLLFPPVRMFSVMTHHT